MNPVDEMDDLLRRAGARWRADQEAPPEPDLEHIVHGKRKSWIPALAAATVAVIAAGALAVLPNHNSTPTQVAQQPNDELLVHDGDQVRATGRVIIAPGQQPLLCAPVPVPMPEAPAKPPTPACEAQYAVTLKGFDASKLGNLRAVQGVRVGYAQVTGTWSSRTIDVQAQTVPPAIPATPNIPADQVPCPVPTGGWSTAPSDFDKVAITRFLNVRRDQAAEPRILYPEGGRAGAPQVMAIGVAHGDLAAFRAAFEKVYDGNVCVYPVKLSAAELDRITTKASDLITRGLGVYGAVPADVGKATVKALVYDDALKTALTPIGLDDLELDTAVQPAR